MLTCTAFDIPRLGCCVAVEDKLEEPAHLQRQHAAKKNLVLELVAAWLRTHKPGGGDSRIPMTSVICLFCLCNCTAQRILLEKAEDRT